MDSLITYNYQGANYLIHVAEYGKVSVFYFINPVSKFCSGIKTYQKNKIPPELLGCLEIWRRKYGGDIRGQL